jgi:hypothetical protein
MLQLLNDELIRVISSDVYRAFNIRSLFQKTFTVASVIAYFTLFEKIPLQERLSQNDVPLFNLLVFWHIVQLLPFDSFKLYDAKDGV